MNRSRMKYFVVCAAVSAAVMIMAPESIFAHCDTMDGPVIKAARRALAPGKFIPEWNASNPPLPPPLLPCSV